MPALVAGIHDFPELVGNAKGVDGRDKPGHDGKTVLGAALVPAPLTRPDGTGKARSRTPPGLPPSGSSASRPGHCPRP
ncbi:hypothetical protein E8L99_04255 [Phreatobacter aquaticus]|uniref:Uncharacterized protein n=1 Tax=Phreatobacter aquaticus TaxID=2570229 RepID=A0A4D7QE81_9HYPH|nr:hypothetical protein E8L99_04255 [Phreatobacter aquaticus]